MARHVAHAEAFVRAVLEPPERLMDLGSGGGVPGLVLAGRFPSAQVILLDAQARRTRFLTEAVTSLGWSERVRAVTGRAEEVARLPAYRGWADVVTARSFGPPPVTAECGAPFLRPGGVLLVAEPPAAPADRWPAAGLALLSLVDDGIVRVPGATVRRLRLLDAVDDRFPRRTGVPARRPLFACSTGNMEDGAAPNSE